MEIATLFHNPGAGGEDHSKKELVAMIENQGYKCRYSSTAEKGWKDDEIDPDSDFIIVAGGDGTIRKVTELLLKRSVLDKRYPIGLIPLGTANNIAKTLNLSGEPEDIVAGWNPKSICSFDVGRIDGIDEGGFFLESFGYGLFPYLMMEMKKRKKEIEDDPQEKLNQALDLINEIVTTYKPRHCNLQVDGEDHSGSYILAEVMNTRSIGPNLMLAPESTPDDGFLEVVALGAKDIPMFCDYVAKIRKEGFHSHPFKTIKGKEILISWEGTHVHVDDSTVKIPKLQEVKIEIREGLLEFLVP